MEDGSWKSEEVKDGYIHESMEGKSIVTKRLGLEAPTLKYIPRLLYCKIILCFIPCLMAK